MSDHSRVWWRKYRRAHRKANSKVLLAIAVNHYRVVGDYETAEFLGGEA